MKLYFNMLKKICNFLGHSTVSFFIIFGLVLTISSCSKYKETISKQEATNRALKSYVVKLTDSIEVLQNNVEDLNKEVDFWKITFQDLELNCQNDASYKDSFEYLKEDLFVYKYKLERIKAYNAIVEKDNSQNVFFRGWIKRVLED